MAGFDLHRLDGGLVVDVQSDLIEVLGTRVVAPPRPVAAAPRRAARPNPVFDLPEGPVALFPQFVAALPRRAMRFLGF